MRGNYFATAASLVLLPAFAASEGTHAQGPATKSVFLSIVDASGQAITDLLPNEIAIAEDNVRLEVTDFKAATSPLSIALLADTTGGVVPFVQDFRRSLTSFVRRVQTGRPDAAISLFEFGGAAVPLSAFTTRTADLEKLTGRLYPRPDAPSVLLEAIGDASKSLSKRLSLRRAIVILNLEPSDEQSALRPNQVVEELRKSGASIWAVSLQEGPLRNAQRDVVLPSLTQNTGGTRDFIFTQSAIESKLVQIADALLSQYEVTYVRPRGAATPKVVQVRIGRTGLTIRAPTWPPR